MNRNREDRRAKALGRRDFLRSAGAGLAGAALGGGILAERLRAAGAREDAPRPNIILLIADDTGWNDVGYHGSDISTPNIDRLAREGVEMDSFYAWPTCSPTRACILMGRPACRFNILAPIAGKSTQALPQDLGTLATVLRGAGYSTHLSGKWHLGLRPEVGPRKYGFETTYGYLHGQIDQFTHNYKYGDTSWHRNDRFIDEEGHATDLIADEVIRCIRERDRQRPFFIYTAWSVPHYPVQEEHKWVAPYEETIENPDRRLNAASMTHMDHAIGRIIREVEYHGIEEETLIIFVSDNGGQKDWTATNGEYDLRHGPYDVLGDNSPLRGWKVSLYEGGIRVPAAFYWPGTLNPSKAAFPCHVIDFLPTLASLAGADVPTAMQAEGMDLGPVLRGRSPDVERMFYWNTGGNLCLRQGEWKLLVEGSDPLAGEAELYDIAVDPLEETDLAASRPDVVARLREIMSRQRAMDFDMR